MSLTGAVLFQATVELFPTSQSHMKFWTEKLKCKSGWIIREQAASVWIPSPLCALEKLKANP